jgi:hypothetical protein
LTADTPRAFEALSLAASFDGVPRLLKATRVVTPPAPRILILIPDRRLTRGLVVRASRISAPSRFA